MATVNGTAITYDASGHAVTNGTIEILYTPLGKVGFFRAQQSSMAAMFRCLAVERWLWVAARPIISGIFTGIGWEHLA